MPVSSLYKKSPPCAIPVALLFLSADFATAQEKEWVDAESVLGLPECHDPKYNGQCAKVCQKSLGNIGKAFRFKMTGWFEEKTDILWGQGPYFYGSYVDEAATHKGLFIHGEVGYIKIKCVDTPTPANPGDPPFVGNTQNGMTTQNLSWGEVYENTPVNGEKVMTAGAFEVTRLYVKSEESEEEKTPSPTEASAHENNGGDGGDGQDGSGETPAPTGAGDSSNSSGGSDIETPPPTDASDISDSDGDLLLPLGITLAIFVALFLLVLQTVLIWCICRRVKDMGKGGDGSGGATTNRHFVAKDHGPELLLLNADADAPAAGGAPAVAVASEPAVEVAEFDAESV